MSTSNSRGRAGTRAAQDEHRDPTTAAASSEHVSTLSGPMRAIVAITRADLDCTAKAVLTALVALADWTTLGGIRSAIPTIARRAGVSVRSAQARLRELEKSGIVVTSGAVRGGAGTPSRRIDLPGLEACTGAGAAPVSAESTDARGAIPAPVKHSTGADPAPEGCKKRRARGAGGARTGAGGAPVHNPAHYPNTQDPFPKPTAGEHSIGCASGLRAGQAVVQLERAIARTILRGLRWSDGPDGKLHRTTIARLEQDAPGFGGCRTWWLAERVAAGEPRDPAAFITTGIRDAWDVPPDDQARYAAWRDREYGHALRLAQIRDAHRANAPPQPAA